MTSPSEGLANGAKVDDSTKTSSLSSSSSPTTPKAKVVSKNTKTNGHPTENSNVESNGDGNGHVNIPHSPQTSPPTTSSQIDVMEQIPSIESQSEQEDTNEEDPGSNGKRDLYVGNLYFYALLTRF
jgi:hypothetical protein